MAKSDTYQALNLDLQQQHNFIRFFNNLPEKPPSTVRLFNRSEYYTCHGEDASIASGFTSAAIKYMGEQPKLSYVCLNKSQFELFLRELLLVRQYRVEVYIKALQKNNDWHLEYKGSPGNLSQFEELLFENSNIEFSNSVIGVRLIQSKTLAVSCVNITEAKFEVCEIGDNECFSELEALIAQIGPKECVLPVGDTPELVSLKNVLERNGILVARVKRSDFSGEDIIQDLNRLLYFHEDQQRNVSAFTETNMKEAMGCLQATIKFLNLTGDEKNFNQFKLSSLDAHRFVRLDNAALYALNVLPKPGSQTVESSVINPNASKTSSLKGILDNCVTVQGRRLLEQWIKQPLKDYNLINDRLDVVEALVKDAVTRTSLIKDSLPRMTDLMPLSRKISCKKGKLQDCYRVYQTVNSIPSMLQILRDTENKCIKAMFIDPISDIIMDLQNFQSMIEQTLDLELVDRGEFLVKCSFDDDLNELHKKKEKIGEKMQRVLRCAAEDLGFEEGKTIKLECNDQHGYFFRVTLKEEQALRKSKNYKIIDAIKGGVRFTNNKLTELNKDYETVKEEYVDRQKAVVAEIFEVAAGYADSLRNLNVLLATVDVLASFATAAVSARIPYTRPKLLKEGSGMLHLTKVRHPCLEAQDHMSFIPNDATFDRGEKILHIITGPNMCGKSTYIRSVGTCVLMAHIGSLVPCQEATISLVDGILVRVGADDCQLKGLSTFMLEMIETSTIIKSATQNSLVIIDELGRGTSTYDGCGIAWAIAEHLATEIKCFSLFATHYHEISRLAQMNSCVGNLHVTAVTTNNTITPLYQVREGECDKSYGVHCARMVGFPEDVIKDAVEYQKRLEHFSGMKLIFNFEQSLKRKVIAIDVRIGGGYEGHSGQFPYQVAIQKGTGEIKELSADDLCSGSLISPNYVLTAARCIAEVTNVTVIIGGARIDELEPEQVKVVSTNFIIPEDYIHFPLGAPEWDIALIKLNTPVELSKNIQPVKLAEGDDEYVGDVAIVAGWGTTYAGQYTVEPVLRYFESVVISYRQCIKDNRAYENLVIPGNHICVFADYKSACNGDNGAPLVIDGVQIGLVATAPANCFRRLPVIYTRVAKYFDWIKENSDI